MAQKKRSWSDFFMAQNHMTRLYAQDDTVNVHPYFGETKLIPPTDIVRNVHNIVVKCDIPGMDTGSFDVNYLNSTVFLRGSKTCTAELAGFNVYKSERFFGSFEHIIALNEPVISASITAVYTNGILTITCPRVSPGDITVSTPAESTEDVQPGALVYEDIVNGFLVIELEMPGVSANDVSVTSDTDSITIIGTRSQEDYSEYEIQRQERTGIEFERLIMLSDTLDIDINNPDISTDKGVVVVRLTILSKSSPTSIVVS